MEKNDALTALVEKIWATEKQLSDLYEQYRAITHRSYESHLPIKNERGSTRWKWTIFMCLGYAFISCVTYLLGIAKSGRNSGLGIPEFFFEVDIAYYAILNFYVLFMVLIPQLKNFKDYQIWTIFFGFWCCHWLIYDWWWWAYEFGVGKILDPAEFWVKPFYSPLLMPNPPMYLFLIEAILGSIMGVYTFFVPRNGKQLAPTLLWLWAVYLNASVMMLLGLEMPWILIVGIIIVFVAFAIAIHNTIRFIKRSKVPDLVEKDEEKESVPIIEKIQNSKWVKVLQFDVLKKPWAFVIIAIFGFMYLFLAINPAIGLYMGMLIWYIIPLLYLVRRTLISILFKFKK